MGRIKCCQARESLKIQSYDAGFGREMETCFWDAEMAEGGDPQGTHRGHQLELDKPQARSLDSNMSPKSFLFLVISDMGSPGVMMDLKRWSGYRGANNIRVGDCRPRTAQGGQAPDFKLSEGGNLPAVTFVNSGLGAEKVPHPCHSSHWKKAKHPGAQCDVKA